MARNFKLKGTLDLKDNATKKVKNFSSSTIGSFKKMLPVLGVAGITGAMTAVISKTLTYADKLGKLNARLGVSTVELDRLRQVADLSGVRFEALSVGMQRLSRRVADAAKGAGPAAKSLKELGLNAEELTKIPLDQQLRAVLKQLEGVENGSEKVRLAFSLLDTEGVGLIQMGKDLDKNLAKVQSNFTPDKVKQAENFNDQMTRVRETFAQLAVRVIPALTKAMQALTTAWDYWAEKINGPSVEKQMAKLRKDIDFFNKKADELTAKGINPYIMLSNAEAAKKKLEELEAQIKKTQEAGGSGTTPTIDTSPIFDDSLKNEVGKTAETTAKIIDLRQRLKENLQQLEIDRLTFIGQNEQAEIQMVQDKYAKMLEEAQGNAEAIKLIEQGKVQELALINDKYRQDEAKKRLDAANQASAVNEQLAGQERARQSASIRQLVDDFKEGEKAKMEVANKTRDFFVNNFSDAFGSVISGSKKAGDAFKDMIQGMIASLAKLAAQKAFTQALGGAGATGVLGSLGSIFGFAGGGNVKANEPIVVGEKGPEIFTPKKSGMIIPNDQIEKKYTNNTSGSAGTVNNESNVSVNVNMDASNSGISDPAQANKIGKQLAMMVKGEVMQVMSDQQRYGGMLYTGRRRTA
jgi:hypothetical protein